MNVIVVQREMHGMRLIDRGGQRWQGKHYKEKQERLPLLWGKRENELKVVDITGKTVIAAKEKVENVLNEISLYNSHSVTALAYINFGLCHLCVPIWPKTSMCFLLPASFLFKNSA